MKKILSTFMVFLFCLSLSLYLISCSGEETEEGTENVEQGTTEVQEGTQEMGGEMKEETGQKAEEKSQETQEAAGETQEQGNGMAGEDSMQVAEAAQKGDPAKGKQVYTNTCASCHGQQGKGDGPAAAALDPKPRDHTGAEYMSSISDEYMFKVISQGGAAVGKSQLMPAWGGTLSEQDTWNVIAYIRQDLCKCQYNGK
ncbi:MAG TPA: cytochrome c [Thermodesulfobacteriota bacterium]|nr:cytochrome c [Thermodesulfobacteriota bacterium]